ncbi:Transposase DDE domain protein [Paenibacillus konkukensis]|uniref:Transposase DDE domain protein n=1 Tax=Paenibacillus konkukensis TaxID=2020716 RepID=A0ABY4RTY7_9BACL|nr:Transposase DDE domain protein [Paenibacillus konkukensis]
MGLQFQAIGRSRGGLTTKIHAIVDALGNPLRFELSGGQSHDCMTGYEMLKSMELTGTNVLADRGYDTNAILDLLQGQQANPVIPSRNLAVFSEIATGGFTKNATG